MIDGWDMLAAARMVPWPTYLLGNGVETVKIKWLGHASFLITSQNGTRIITDPYEPGFRGIISYDRIDEAADIITVSHEHGDHNAVGDVPGAPQVIRGVGSRRAREIEFEGLGTYHDKSQGSQRGPNTIISFVVDGIRLCHLGDLGHPLSDSDLAELGDVGVLLAVTGGGPTLDLSEVNELCDNLQPKVVIPMHLKNEKCTYPLYGADDFVIGKDSVRRTGTTEVEYTMEQLPASMEVVVLDHAL